MRKVRHSPQNLAVAVQASAVLMMAALTPAIAQEQEADPSAPIVLDTLVIQGTKIAREFTETTASVGVMDSQMIQEQGITDLKDSFSQFGNVRQFDGGGSGADSGFVIRGLGATQGVSVATGGQYAPLTSVIIDGTPQSFNSMIRGARGMWDVEQVEIFRGPQSTLQGRGTMAGAVILRTKEPTFFPEGEISVIGGGGDRREGAFMLSGPLVEDVLAARITGEYRSRDKGINYTLPGSEFLGEDRYRNLRAKFLLTPPDTPGLSFLLTLSKTYDKPGLAVSTTPDDWFRREYNAAGKEEAREADNLNISLEARYDLGDGRELTSVTSILRASTQARTIPGADYYRNMSWDDENVTQDLRLTFGADSDLSGVVGLFYGRFAQPRNDFMQDVLPNGSPIIAQDITQDNKTTSLAAYGDVTWRFAPAWSLLAGGRLAYEKVSSHWTYCGPAVPSGGRCELPNPMKERDSEISDTVFLPKLGLTHHFSDHQTLSATFQRGYRSGFVAITEGGDAGPSEIKPEYLSSYELAWRIEDPALAWRFGATAFYSRYTDQQINSVRMEGDIPITRTRNVGKSEMYGAELEGSYAFDNGLSLFGSVGLLKTKFLDYYIGGAAGTDYTGNEFPESPQVTAGLGVAYHHDSGFYGTLNASYTGSYYSFGSTENDPELKVDNFTHVNARLGYQKDNWEVAAYVDNLFDSDYVTSLNKPAPPTSATVSEPRRIGVELRARF